jgi:hypothetical protein
MASDHHSPAAQHKSWNGEAGARPSRSATNRPAAAPVADRSLPALHPPDLGKVSIAGRQQAVRKGARARLPRQPITSGISSHEVLQPHRLQAGVEGRDHARAHLPMAAIGAAHHAQIGQSAGLRLQDGRGVVSRSVVYHHPKGWRHRLSRHAVERATEVLRLVPAWRDEQVASRRGHEDIREGRQRSPIGPQCGAR